MQKKNIIITQRIKTGKEVKEEMVFSNVLKCSRSTVLHRWSDRNGLVTHPYVHRTVSIPRGFKEKLTQILVWYNMIWYDMIWYDMIRYDMIWYDMIWYDMIWYDTTLCHAVCIDSSILIERKLHKLAKKLNLFIQVFCKTPRKFISSSSSNFNVSIPLLNPFRSVTSHMLVSSEGRAMWRWPYQSTLMR